jgi:hypothetical protein
MDDLGVAQFSEAKKNNGSPHWAPGIAVLLQHLRQVRGVGHLCNATEK